MTTDRDRRNDAHPPEHLIYEPLALTHTDALGALLLNEQVYRHIGGQPPSLDRFRLGMQRVVAGPPANRRGDEWVNYAVRRAADGVLLGRLEATVHDGIAEVAFLFGPAHWGKGYATQGLRWLNQLLLARPDVPALWATTVPGNQRCQLLLQRCGYRPASGPRPARMVSHDEGDLVFRGPTTA